MNNQREIIYAKRNEILDNDSIHESTLALFRDHISDIVNMHLVDSNSLNDNDLSEILEASNENLLKSNRVVLSEIKDKKPDDIIDFIYDRVVSEYEEKLVDIPIEVVNEFEKAITLRVIDSYWMEHISTMSHLKRGYWFKGLC